MADEVIDIDKTTLPDVAPRCSAKQKEYAAGFKSPARKTAEDKLYNTALDAKRDAEWTNPDGQHSGIFIRDGNLTAAGKKVWWKAFYEWKGWETQTYGEKVAASLQELWENPIGKKLLTEVKDSTPHTNLGYKALIIRPYDLDPTDDMEVHEHDLAEVESLVNRIETVDLTADQVRSAKNELKDQWDAARIRMGDCFQLHQICKEVLSTNPQLKIKANKNCPVPDISAKVDAAADLAGLRVVAGEIKAFIDGTPRYWNKFWRDGSHTIGTTWTGDEVNGRGKSAAVVFHPAIDHLPGVHVSDNNGAITYTMTRYKDGNVVEQIGTNSGIPISLGLAHELIHGLHQLKGVTPSKHDFTTNLTYPYYSRNCPTGGTADPSKPGIHPGVGEGFHFARSFEEWKTVGIIDAAATPAANKWPACIGAGGDLTNCHVTENNIRAAWRVKADGTPGKYPNIPTRASYTSRAGCQLDDSVNAAADGDDGAAVHAYGAAGGFDGDGAAFAEGAAESEEAAGADEAVAAAAAPLFAAAADAEFGSGEHLL